MSAGLRGDISKIRALERSLRELPRVVGAKVATAAASAITTLAHATFATSSNPYGDPWDPGKDGQTVTLRKSGRLAQFAYIAIGTRLRAQLGPKYARYQVGRRPILPRNGSRMPAKYAATLRAKSSEVIRAELEGGR
jgi:hypothetical protein